MPYLWDDQAWADYQYWLTQDKKTLRRINALLKDIARIGGTERGIGKSELLRHSAEGLSSVRIDAKKTADLQGRGRSRARDLVPRAL